MSKVFYDVIYKRDNKEYKTMSSYENKNDVEGFVQFILSVKNSEVKGILKTTQEEEFISFDDFKSEYFFYQLIK